MNTLIYSLGAVASALLCSCSTTHFEGVEKVGERYQEDVGAYVVQIRFEVLEGDLPVQGLSLHDIEMYEDEVRATTESIQELSLDELKLPVTLLLDTSYSIYRSGAIEALKSAANIFIHDLRSEGFEVDLLSFDSSVYELEGIGSIPATWEGRNQTSRWTSLYYAVQQALERNQTGILVIFSDGADNYSQNHGVESFNDIWPMVEQRQVHAVGFGAVKDEFDRHGNDAVAVLKKLASNGTYGYASNQEAIDDVFEFISRRLRNIYFVEYYSPNRTGTHHLEVRYKSASTEPIPFHASSPR